jgi:hypothetical protein
MKKPFNKNRTPKKTLDAVFPPQYKARHITLYPVSTVSFMALDKLESPFLAGRFKARVLDIANALFVLSRTADELEQLMGQTDPEFRILCARWCRGIPPDLVLESIGLVTRIIGDGLKTYVAGKNPR